MIVGRFRRAYLIAGLSAVGLMAAGSPGTGGAAVAAAGANDWPQWRGPTGTGSAAADAAPPTTWGETKNVKWKVKLPGEGSSTPIVWGDKVFIQAAIPTGKSGETSKTAEPAKAADAPPAAQAEPRTVRPPGGPAGPGGPGGPGRRGRPRGGGGFGGGPPPTQVYQFALLCLDRASGKTLWQKTLREEVPHEGHHKDHGFSSHSPVTDGQVVIAYFGSRGLHCLDLDGNLKWSADLGKMKTKNGFGEGSAPALHGDTVVVKWDHEGPGFIAAFDKATGKERWRQARDEDTSWSSPVVVEHAGRAQVIAAASKKVRSYDLATGAPLWEVGPLTANVIPTPVAAGDMVYLISGFRGAQLFAVKLGRTGDLTGTDAVVWQHKKATPYVPSPLLHDGRLYFFSGNNAVLTVLDAAGGKPVVDTERLEEMQNVYASPVAAGGHVYLVARNGVTQVLKAEADKVEVVATNTLDDRLDASPAVAGKEIFLRGQASLYCIAEK
jgi:outer membrane protein assembly factor BamB